MYEHSVTGKNWPSGGGFSVTKYTLDGLYEQHQLDRNWWTASNNNLPLCRYLGCKLTLYQSYSTDYVVNTNLCHPMVATHLLYLSCQPSFMMMNKNAIFVPSKLTQKLKRGKKTIKLKPPHEMSNRWFFTKEFAKAGLCMLTATAASFDNYYIATDNLSNNCSFNSLNPLFFQRHDFIQPPVTGYITQESNTIQKKLFHTTQHFNHTTNLSTKKISDLQITYLGMTKQDQQGEPLTDSNANNYFTTPTFWGNPFTHEYFTVQESLLTTNKTYDEIKQKTISNDEIGPGFFTLPSEQLYTEIRYAPDRDTGSGNKLYLKSVGRDTSFWDPPHDEDLIADGFPLWALVFGFVSWQIKLGKVNNIYRSHIAVIESDFLTPKQAYYIPLDYDFIEGKSHYMPENEQHLQTSEDKKNWYPCLLYQLLSLETIAKTGPGIAKLGGRKSVEAKLKYSFWFKFGGCKPKMDTISNPLQQETYPFPGHEPTTYPLQNPSFPQEYHLFQFDEHQGIITKRAAKRITSIAKTQKALFSTTGSMDPSALQTTQATSDSEEETEDPTLLKLQLRELKRQRRHLEQQIQHHLNQP